MQYDLSPTHVIKNVISVHSIVSFYHKFLDADYWLQGDQHNFWEMVYLQRGEMLATSDQHTFLLKSGQIIFHKPNEFHNLTGNHLTDSQAIIIGFRSDSPDLLFFEHRVFSVSKEIEEMLEKFLEMAKKVYFYTYSNGEYFLPAEISDTAPFGGEQLMKLKLEEILLLIIQEQTSPQPVEKKVVYVDRKYDTLCNRTIDYMKKHLYGELTVEDLCREMKYGKTFLSNKFKNGFPKMSLMRYYQLLKIEEAKRLIETNQYSFAKIADLLQFETPQYFSRVFSKHVGCSPSEYKKRFLKKKT